MTKPEEAMWILDNKRDYLLGGFLSLIALGLGCYFWGWSIDDPWIAYRYAQNLARGQGLVFNPGERIEGYSSFTMVLLAAPMLRLGVDPDLPCRLIALLCSAAIPIILVCFSFGRSRRGETLAQQVPPLLLASAAFLYAVNPSAALWSVGGLETNIQALVLLFSVLVFLGEEQSEIEGRPPVFRFSFLWIFLASLTRIEGPILFCAVSSYLALKSLLLGRRPGRGVVLGALAFGLLYLGYTIFRFGYFGDLLPNTFYAKATGPKGEQFRLGLKYTLKFFFYNGGALYLLLGLPALSLALRLVTRLKNAAASDLPEDETLSFSLRLRYLCLSIICWNLFFIIYCGGDWMFLWRFFVHFLPVLLLALQEELCLVWRAVARGPLRRGSKGLLAVTLIVTTIAGLGLQTRHGWRETRPIMLRVRAGEFHQVYFEVGNYLRQVAPPGSTLAGAEAGIIPYVSGMQFIDMLALVDKHLAQLPGNLWGKSDPDYIMSRNPDYLMLHTHLKKVDGKFVGYYYVERQLLAHPDFYQRYRAIRHFVRGTPASGENNMTIFQRIN